MKKYVIIALSAFIIEIASTLYISYVAEHNKIGMLLFSTLGPFLNLPFAGYMVESENWTDRIKMATSLAAGYFLGCIVVILFLIK